MTTQSSNVVWQDNAITRQAREASRSHRGAVIWFTGLSGSGKSTLCNALEQRLFARGVATYVLDGDNVRHGLCGDLGFSDDDRAENIRRVAHVTKLFVDAGIVVLTAFISPFRHDRAQARSIIGDADFLEVHVSTDLATCEARDPKGLYAKARAHQIKSFTGIDSPYEAPEDADLVIDTASVPVDAAVERLIELLRAHHVLKA